MVTMQEVFRFTPLSSAVLQYKFTPMFCTASDLEVIILRAGREGAVFYNIMYNY